MTDFRQLNHSLYKPQTMACPACGHEEHEQWHKLARVHVTALVKCAAAIDSVHRPVNRDEMDLDRNQNGNFAAMRWWGLIESKPDDRWAITPLGWAFLANERGVPLHVLTAAGKYVGESVGTVSCKKILGEEAWRKADYLAHRVYRAPAGALVA